MSDHKLIYIPKDDTTTRPILALLAKVHNTSESQVAVKAIREMAEFEAHQPGEIEAQIAALLKVEVK